MTDLAVGSSVVREHFLVPDVRCANCCLTIEKALDDMPEISNLDVNYAEKRLSFSSTSDQATGRVLQTLDAMGYPLVPDVDGGNLEQFNAGRRRLLARLGVAGIGMMQVMMFALADYVSAGAIEPAYQSLMRWASLVIAVPVTFYSAMPFHLGAIRDVTNRTLGMDVPVSLAILSAFFLSAFNTVMQSGEVYFDSACMFTFFLLTGRFLEFSARQSFKVEQSLGDHLLPDQVQLLDGQIVLTSELKPGDRVEVRPGEMLPADAVVLSGSASVDESAFSGESRPLLKTAGSRVLAGSMNLDGLLIIEVHSRQQEWVISHLSELYRRAAAFRPPFAVLADRVARYFVSVVLLLAMGAGVYWWQAGSTEFFAIALAVLVVSCPCALSLATPVAYTIATGAVRNLGVLISSGAFLEKLGQVDAVVLDKTGTLTEGTLSLEEIRILGSQEEAEVIDIAAAIEGDSLHPVAECLRRESSRFEQVTDQETIPGMGVSGVLLGARWRLGKPAYAGDGIEAPDGGNWVLLSSDGEPVAWFRFVDVVREGAGQLVSHLRRSVGQVDAFSGDLSAAGRSLLQQLGIDHPHMGMTPDDKINGLRRMQSEGRHVLMVGDGLNDAGAMAAADVSLAVNPVDSVVQSAADATLISGRLQAIPGLFDYARQVRSVIRQNLSWALAYNLSVIPLAVAGFVPPWAAALGMSMSSLLVTLNACRLARV